MKDVFARFDVDLGENANWYVQGSWAQAENASDWIQWVVSPNGRPPQLAVRQQPLHLTRPRRGCWARASTADLAAAGRLCLPAVPATSPQTGSTPPPPPAGAGTCRTSAVPSYIWNTGRRASPPRQARTGCTARSATRSSGTRKPASPESSANLQLGCVLQPRQQRADGHQSQQHGQRQVPGFAGCGARTAAPSSAG